MANRRGIYKRGKFYWIRYAGLQGETHCESSKSARFADAEALLLARKQAVREGRLPDAASIKAYSFRDLIAQYDTWCARQRSYKSKQWYFKVLFEEFGELPLRSFSTLGVEQFQARVLNRENKPATANRLLATLKHMFVKAVEWRMVEESVQRCVRRVKLLPENNARLRFLSVEECKKLVDAAEGIVRSIVVVALHSGMRKSEILGLRWDHVDFGHNFFLLPEAVTKNASRREIPINGVVRDVLKSVPRRLDTPFVFYNPGTGTRYYDIKKGFAKALLKAGITDFRFHDLRHTFASQLVMAGIDLTTVKELLGHKTLAMTLRYAHLAASHKAKAVVILEHVLGVVGGKQQVV